MRAPLRFTGYGHAVGSKVISNLELARAARLEPDWYYNRTGIAERRVCDTGETVLTLAAAAVQRACEDADLELAYIGEETVLIHIQNGPIALTPPAAILLCNHLGLKSVRALGIDGVCAEPIAALEHAALLLSNSICRRVVISAAVDFIRFIDPSDPNTVALFGSGAGALVLESDSTDSGELLALHWETHSEHSRLGQVPVLGCRPTTDGVEMKVGYYDMDGPALAKVALRVVPQVITTVLKDAGWEPRDVDLIIAHQPNAKLLDMAIRMLRIDAGIVPMPVVKLGNMGPASLLVNLALAKEAGRLVPGTRLLLVAFGLGFSCGAAAVKV